MKVEHKEQHWWGSYDLASSTALSLRIGPLFFTVTRGAREWRLTFSWRAGDEQLDGTWEKLEEAVSGETVRFVMKKTGKSLRLLPVLADRAIVTTPRIPLRLPREEKAELLVGSPLWLRIETDHMSGAWPELPMKRPNDTWFGPSTMEGELCYATQTQAVLDPDNLPVSVRRAITPILIHNHTSSPFEIERIKIPVPNLSLYADAGGNLWTDQIVVTNSTNSLAQVRIERGAPGNAVGGTLICPARVQVDQDFWSLMFTPLHWLEEQGRG